MFVKFIKQPIVRIAPKLIYCPTILSVIIQLFRFVEETVDSLDVLSKPAWSNFITRLADVIISNDRGAGLFFDLECEFKAFELYQTETLSGIVKSNNFSSQVWRWKFNYCWRVFQVPAFLP